VDMNIKFSHYYPKLHGQKSATLLMVLPCDRSELTNEFIIYDTRYYEDGNDNDCFYPLPPNRYLILVFLGDIKIPFTTVRRWTPEKERYYKSGIGKDFDIIIDTAETR